MIVNLLLIYLLSVILDLSFTVLMSSFFTNTLITYYEDMNEIIELNANNALSPSYLCNVASFIPIINLYSVYRKIKFVMFK